MIAGARVSDATANEAADVMQAAYFRGYLANERAGVAAHIAKQRADLAARPEANQSPSTRRMLSQVRSMEAELRYLDGLIAKLDTRFPASWSARMQHPRRA